MASISACSVNQAETIRRSDTEQTNSDLQNQTEKTEIEKPKMPNLQAEILDDQNAKSDSLIGSFDFKNFTYPLPRGWQDADGMDITLENGKRRLTEDKIGMEYVTTKFFDVTGDGEDEALVILKVLTGSITIPQNVYIFEWKEGNPELIWHFRTGDRADGGLKSIYMEDGELVVELFGRDRYLFNQMETSQIVGDDQQLCCPTHWTRTRYKFVDNKLLLEGDRLTYSLKDKDAEPIRNMNEIKLREERGS
jgi:hypothetical protein